MYIYPVMYRKLYFLDDSATSSAHNISALLLQRSVSLMCVARGVR